MVPFVTLPCPSAPQPPAHAQGGSSAVLTVTPGDLRENKASRCRLPPCGPAGALSSPLPRTGQARRALAEQGGGRDPHRPHLDLVECGPGPLSDDAVRFRLLRTAGTLGGSAREPGEPSAAVPSSGAASRAPRLPSQHHLPPPALSPPHPGLLSPPSSPCSSLVRGFCLQGSQGFAHVLPTFACFRGRGRREREHLCGREASTGCLLHMPGPGIEPTTLWFCADVPTN